MSRQIEGLYTPASEDFEIVSYVDAGRAFGRNASNLPLIVWPNGHWCFPANFFMLRLLDKGHSRFNRGGTLGTYAAHISHLLRYCADNRVDLPELSDAHFTLFVNSLKAAKFNSTSLAPRRTSATVINVAETCLSFLSLVGELYGIQLVGPDAAIKAEILSMRAHGRSINRWTHHSLPTRSAAHKRLPVSSDAIQRLRNAAATLSSSTYLVRRRLIMLRLLEITGGRRSEIAALSVKSVQQAASMQAPRLELITVKGRGRDKNRTREVPISKADARLLNEFSRVSRAVVVRRTCGKSLDSGALLVSETTGGPLCPNTITQEITVLRECAALKSRVCAHMFRHRFITNIFKALIEEYNSESPSAFRKLLLSSEELKTRVCQWSGHSNIVSLTNYIHLAFEEVGGIGLAASSVRANLSIKEFVTELKSFDFSKASKAELEALKISAKNLADEFF
jgi:integrase